MFVQQTLCVERNESCDQLPERFRRMRVDVRHDRTEVFRQGMGFERHARDRTKASTAPTFKCPEQVRFAVSIDDPNGAIGRHHFRLQQRSCGVPVSFREASKATAQDESGDADRRAAAALDVPAGARGHRIVDMHPDRTCTDGDCRPSRLPVFAALRNESIMHFDPMHAPRPDQQRVRGVGRSLVAMSPAFDHESQITLASEIDRLRNIP